MPFIVFLNGMDVKRIKPFISLNVALLGEIATTNIINTAKTFYLTQLSSIYIALNKETVH